MSDPTLREPGALGGAFGASPAASGLAGKLTRRAASAGASTTAASPPRPAASEGQAVQESESAVASSPPTAEQRAEPQVAPKASTEEPTYQVSVYVLPAAVRALESLRRRTHQTNAALAYDALDAVRDRLPVLVAERRRGPGRAADSLFPGRQTRNAQEAAASEGRRQLWSIQATDAELAVLDDLIDQTGARSRSEVISCAVEAVHILRPRAPRDR